MAHVRVTKHYEMPGQKIWERIGDPAKLSEWHPAIEKTETLDGGRKRVNTVVGGGLVCETILEQADRHHTFRIDDSPLPIDNFVATIRVREEGEGACSVEWDATFEAVGVPDHEAVELNRGFFQAGLDAL